MKILKFVGFLLLLVTIGGCLGLRNSDYYNYVRSHNYKCKVLGGEKESGGYKRGGRMYLILQEINTGKVFSLNAMPEDYFMYSNKPGTILTYNLQQSYIFPNPKYDLWRTIIIGWISLLASLLLALPLWMGLEDYEGIIVKAIWIYCGILFVVSVLSYNILV